MPSRRAPLPLIVPVLALAACAHRPAPAPTTATCLVRASGVTNEGHELRTRAFTVCLPDDWQWSGRTAWRHGSDSIQWHLGQYPAGTIIRQEQFTASASGVMRSLRQPPPDSCETLADRLEAIARHEVRLVMRRCGETYATAALWLGTVLSFRGMATSRGAAEQQFGMYRTVRLPSDR